MLPELKQMIQKIMSDLKQTVHGQTVLDSMEMSDMLITNDSDYDEHRKIIKKVYPEEGQ
jgi:uncharacterized protein YfbU (UPF0304 family)